MRLSKSVQTLFFENRPKLHETIWVGGGFFVQIPTPKFMKATLITLMLALMIIPVEAKKFLMTPAARAAARIEARQEAKQRLEREQRHDAVQKLIDKKDSNHDGSLSKDEYLSKEPDQKAAGKKFGECNKNGDLLLQRSEIEALLGF